MDHLERSHKPKRANCPNDGCPLSHEERRQRFLDALRAAGGELNRTRVRQAIHPVFRAAAFDELAVELMAAGVVEAEKVQGTHRHHHGHDVPYWVTWYRLTERGRDFGGEQATCSELSRHPNG